MSQLLSDIRAGGGIITAVNGGNNITVNTVAGVATVNVSGTTNHAVQVGNALGALTSLGIGLAGQVLTSNGPGVDPSFQAPSFATLTFDGNVGTASPAANIIIFNTANSTPIFSAAGNTLTLDFGLSNLGLGSSFPALAGGASNIGVGNGALNSVTSGSANIAVGLNSQAANTQGFFNTGLGGLTLQSLTIGSFNVALGYSALNALTTSDANIAIGASALSSLLTGTRNIAIGRSAGSALTGTESSNIYIGNAGVITENNVIRIGTDGAGVGQQNTTVIAGDVSSVRSFTADSGNITAVAGDVVITAGNLEITAATNAAGTQGLISFIGAGSANRFISARGTGNTFVGYQSGNTTLTIGSSIGNSALGLQALQALTTGAGNIAVGQAAGTAITTGSNNVALGLDALEFLTTGSNNVIVGASSGSAYTTAESNNIIIGEAIAGTVAESNKIRIGNASNNACFIAGIAGVTVSNSAVVVIDTTTGQLGTASTALAFTYTNVNTTPYVVLDSDEYLGVDSSGAPITIQLPNAPGTGRVVIIKDRTGSAATNNITVTTVGGIDLIDGFMTFTMNNNYQSVQVLWSGSDWQIF